MPTRARRPRDDLRTGELFFGLPAALLVLLLVFGAVVAGLVPLVLAIVSIIVALALTALVGQAFELSLFAVNMLTAMGLALGIDYSLFVLSRYREERSRGREQLDAIAAAGATATRAVLFSGMTFVLAMFGMLLVPNTIFRSLAAGAILVGIVSVLAALTLLPAVLGLLGDRVNALRIPYFGRAAEQAGQRGALLGRDRARASCAARCSASCSQPRCCSRSRLRCSALETGSQGISTLPDRFESKHGFVLLNEDFPRPDDRADRDRRRRRRVARRRCSRHRAARGCARRAPDLRRAQRRDERRRGRDSGSRCRSPATRSVNARSTRSATCAAR